MSTTDVAERPSPPAAARKPRARRKSTRVVYPPSSLFEDVPDEPLTEEERVALAVARGYATHGPYSPRDPRLWPDLSDVVTEDDTPVDNMFTEKQQHLLPDALYASWSGPGPGRPFLAMSNVGLFYQFEKPPVVPDMLLSLNLEPPQDLGVVAHRSYFMWVYAKPPDVIVEIVSDRRGGEADRKMDLYARIRVTYYVIHDPFQRLSRDVLRAYELAGGTYRRVEDGVLASVGLRVGLWDGWYYGMKSTWLRWFDADGALLLTGAEQAEAVRQRADEERQRADAEKEHAEAEKQRADTAEGRVERLAARLRALGVDPDVDPPAG